MADADAPECRHTGCDAVGELPRRAIGGTTRLWYCTTHDPLRDETMVMYFDRAAHPEADQ